MARKKTITRNQILNAAFDIVAREGFSKLTARKIAGKMKCSTQPIYLEFENMDDLKDSLFEKIEEHLVEVIFSKDITGDPLMDMNLNYVSFARNERSLYRSVYIDEHEGASRINDFGYRMFMKNVDENEKFKDLSLEKKEALFSATWVVATGLASLTAGGMIQPSNEQIIQMMTDTIDSVIASDRNQIVTTHFSE